MSREGRERDNSATYINLIRRGKSKEKKRLTFLMPEGREGSAADFTH